MSAGETNAGSEEEVGWLFLRPAAVPQRWRERAVDMAMVPLLPDEARQLLAGVPVAGTREEDYVLLERLASGDPTHEIARSLQLSQRSVERRIARLRRRFHAASKQELVRVLTSRGFGTGRADRKDAG